MRRLLNNSCTCPDLVKRRRRCKHIWAVLLATSYPVELIRLDTTMEG
ncbi:MAG: SWIM zinc finger family protein [Deltaproteobacteria bacterium]|nr:SWIM zinc finger family protein [Deltaproteobacteria bacterium]